MRHRALCCNICSFRIIRTLRIKHITILHRHQTFSVKPLYNSHEYNSADQVNAHGYVRSVKHSYTDFYFDSPRQYISPADLTGPPRTPCAASEHAQAKTRGKSFPHLIFNKINHLASRSQISDRQNVPSRL